MKAKKKIEKQISRIITNESIGGQYVYPAVFFAYIDELLSIITHRERSVNLMQTRQLKALRSLTLL